MLRNKDANQKEAEARQVVIDRDRAWRLIPGFFPGAVVSLAAVAFHYSVWVAIAIVVVSFVGVNGGILLYYKWFFPNRRFPDA